MRECPRFRLCFAGLLLLTLASSSLVAAPRQHSITFGNWRTVQTDNETPGSPAVRIRELMIDGRVREYTSGALHEVTDRLFVIRRAQRLNDSLPGEAGRRSRWIWRLEGWISVDRQTGHVAQLNLPAFDPDSSAATWYRDYVAYCGSSEDGAHTYTIVFQLGKRKPLLKKEAAGAPAACSQPAWERNPARVTFNVAGEKSSFVLRARNAESQAESNTAEGPE